MNFFIAYFTVSLSTVVLADAPRLHMTNGDLEQSSRNEVREQTTSTRDQGYFGRGKWFGRIYFYVTADGKEFRAKNASVAKADGQFLDKDKNTVAYKKGDVLFEVPALGWFKGPPDAEIVDSVALVPNPEHVEMTDFEKEVAYLTNRQRERHGLRPLKIAKRLMSGARNHSHWMAHGGGLQHTSAGDRAENIAWNQSSPEEVVTSWMNSSGHRANILGRYSTFGVAMKNNGNGPYWTQQFQF